MVNPAGQDGETISNPKDATLPITVSIGGIDMQPLWAGLIYTGELQINVKIPDNVATGNVPLVLTVGGAASRKDATIAVK